MLPVSYSTFRERDLGEYISRNYDIGKVMRCVFMHRGMNDSYLVETLTRKYIYRVYRSGWRDSLCDVSFEIDLLRFLHANGVSVSIPVATTGNEYVNELSAPEGRRFGVLFTLAEGSALDLNAEDICFKYGKEAAQIHAGSATFQTRHSRPHLDLEYLVDQPLQVIRACMVHRPDDYQLVFRVGTKLKEAIDRVGGLDWGICHGDLHGYNAHMLGDHITHFDFDLCGFGWRAYILAVFRFALEQRFPSCVDGEQQVAMKWNAFLAGYQSVRKVQANDMTAVPFFAGVRRLWLMSLSLKFFKDLDITGSIDAEDIYFEDELDAFREMDQTLF